MTSETLDLFMACVGFMQFHAVGMLVLAEAVAVQAHVVVHFGCLLNFIFVTGVFAACFIGNKLGVVNCHQTSFDHLVGHFMAIRTARLDCIVNFVAFYEMAGEAGIIIYREVFVPFKMAVTCTA